MGSNTTYILLKLENVLFLEEGMDSAEHADKLMKRASHPSPKASLAQAPDPTIAHAFHHIHNSSKSDLDSSYSVPSPLV